jgi:hypothetical protein
LPELRIELVTTLDDNHGPLPPYGSRLNGWRVVRRDGGKTLWRRLSLQIQQDI